MLLPFGGSTKRTSKAKPFQPASGRDFELETAPTVVAKTRGVLAQGITSFVGAVLAATGLYGLATEDYAPLLATWSVAGPTVGAIVTYYFGP